MPALEQGYAAGHWTLTRGESGGLGAGDFVIQESGSSWCPECVTLFCGDRNVKGATSSRSVAPQPKLRNYSLLFPAFLTLAQRALAAAEIAALPAALIFVLGFCAGVADVVVPLIFAHLAC